MKIIDYVHQGGVIMYILLALNVIGVATMLFKFFQLAIQKSKNEEIANMLANQLNENRSTHHNVTAIVELTKRELSFHMSKLEKGLNTVKIIAAISPLLGLLGTVIGVLISFSRMAQLGLGDPAAFASGISLALLTTVGGLIVAIPHYIGHNYLIGFLDEVETKLEKSLLAKVL